MYKKKRVLSDNQKYVSKKEYFRSMNLKKQQWKFHLLLVVIIIAMDFYGDYVYKGLEGFTANFTYPRILGVFTLYFAFFFVYTINYLLICRYTISRKKFYAFAFAALGLVFIFAGIRYFLEEIVVYNITGEHNYFDSSRNFMYYVFDNSYYAVKAILYSTSLYLLFEYIENKNRVYELEIEQKKAELNFLKSQLEPHFLFNTLNSFYTDLIDTQPKTAKDIYRLSESVSYTHLTLPTIYSV